MHTTQMPTSSACSAAAIAAAVPVRLRAPAARQASVQLTHLARPASGAARSNLRSDPCSSLHSSHRSSLCSSRVPTSSGARRRQSTACKVPQPTQQPPAPFGQHCQHHVQPQASAAPQPTLQRPQRCRSPGLLQARTAAAALAIAVAAADSHCSQCSLQSEQVGRLVRLMPTASRLGCRREWQLLQP